MGDMDWRALFEHIRTLGVGFWELVFAACLIVVAFKSPDILKTILMYLNERRQIQADIDRRNKSTLDKLRTQRQRRVAIGSDKT